MAAFRMVTPIITAILAFIPIVYVISLIILFYQDLPFSDQWEAAIPLLQRSFAGTLTLQDMISQHNEHRPLFSRLIWLPLAHLTHWNTAFEIAVTVVLAFGLVCLLWWQIRRTMVLINRPILTLLIPLTSALFFSMSQYESWFQSYSLQWMLHACAVVAGIVILSQPELNARRLTVAIGAGLVATFTFASGLLFWIIGFGLIVGARPVRSAYRATGILMGIWLVACLVVGAIYFTGYIAPGTGSNPSAWLSTVNQPLNVLMYFFTWLGAPILAYYPAVLVGVVGLTLLVCTLFTIRTLAAWRVMLPYLGLAGYALLNAGMISLGRSSLGWQQALSPRYMSISALFWIALVVMLYLTAHTRKDNQPMRTDGIWSRVPALMACIAVLTVVSSAGSTYLALKYRYVPMRAARMAIRAGDDSDAALQQITDDIQATRDRDLPFLKQYSLSLYRDP